MALKDATWATVGVVTAGNLSNTFGSSDQTDTWLKADGALQVKYQLSSVTLGTATEIRVTPAFRDSAGTVTYPYKRDGSPVYWPLSAANRETPPFKIGGRYEVCAELWTDAATGATGAATVQAIRVKE